jgi:hypothetical protein
MKQAHNPKPDGDTARELIINAMSERRFTAAYISAACGMNASYMHQYLFGRKSPRFLPYEIRLKVAELLALRETDLRPDAGKKLQPTSGPAPASAQPGQIQSQDMAMLPVYLDHGDIRPDMACDWIAAPDSPHGINHGIWITTERGRLRRGDLAYVRRSIPPRPGDLVTVQQDARLLTIGTLDALTGDSITVNGQAYDRNLVTICKIVSALFA